MNASLLLFLSDSFDTSTIMVRQEPWASIPTPFQITEKVRSGQRLPISNDCPYYDVIVTSWDQDPTKRPSFKGDNNEKKN